jgi:hypothetical protein
VTPSLVRPGRLVRLGVVLDPRHAPARAALVATLCDRAGIDAVWACDPGAWPGGDGPTALAETLAAAGPRLASATLGAIIPAGLPPSDIDAAVTAAGCEVEVSVPGDDDAPLPLLAARHRTEAVDELTRRPRPGGAAVMLPASVGRTTAEARARADADPLFAGWHPADAGLFGTLEQCQDTVIALAHAGVVDVRCVLPGAPDVHDVIAQLSAVATGDRRRLDPAAPRSKAPDPPVGWGGRSRR